jgi:peptidoglycan/LPS O-acetylase OafA/YrhL
LNGITSAFTSTSEVEEGVGLRPSVERRHFHTFDALRCFAFLKVFFYHIPIAYPAAFVYLKAGGDIAVRFFFVLSGFLITYLIVAEKKRNGCLNFKRYFVRRALRIWPLYYLMVAFAFSTPFILSRLNLDHSNQGYQPNFLFTIAFLENYVGIATREAPNVSPLGVMWSLCVEEHFYIVWGGILYFLDTRHLPKLILGSLALSIISRIVFVALGYPTLDLLTNLDLFALGALPAYLLLERRHKFERAVKNLHAGVKISYIAVVILITLVAPHVRGPVVEVLAPTALGVLFAGLLAIFLPSQTTFGISDNNVFSKLGIYTYGLYLYHTIVINGLMQLFRRAGLPLELPAYGILFIASALGVSIGISMLSYRYFEKPFLALKRYA